MQLKFSRGTTKGDKNNDMIKDYIKREAHGTKKKKIYEIHFFALKLLHCNLQITGTTILALIC